MTRARMHGSCSAPVSALGLPLGTSTDTSGTPLALVLADQRGVGFVRRALRARAQQGIDDAGGAAQVEGIPTIEDHRDTQSRDDIALRSRLTAQRVWRLDVHNGDA